MPTVILLDVSLSMCRPVVVSAKGEELPLRHLALQGINTFLDYLATHCKLEFVALIEFSSLYKVLCPFTRDLESIRNKLSSVEEFDKTGVGVSIQGVNQLVEEEWGSTLPCQIILVTDFHLGIGHGAAPVGVLGGHSPFTFPACLNVMGVSPMGDRPGLSAFQRMCDATGEGSVYLPHGPISTKSIQQMFVDMSKTHYQSFIGTLHCGELQSPICLCPPPQPYNYRSNNYEEGKINFSEHIKICGFFDIVQVSSPAALSRHLVLPLTKGDGSSTSKNGFVSGGELEEIDVDNDGGMDDGKVPSLCVLLHGALKVESMAALCTIGQEWFGILYSWADNRRKSNLMLTTFFPGSCPVPWLGDLKLAGPSAAISDESFAMPTPAAIPQYPIPAQVKRSYTQNCVSWIVTSGLQADIQKILRHARKLPDKTSQFYKELNRIKRAALSYGFVELLDGLAAIFERECTLLPGSAHPDCALQLTHAASLLRIPSSRDLKYTITAMQTKYSGDRVT